MRNLNLTVFGPPHVGKSTLAGLVSYRDDPAHAERRIDRARRELGPHVFNPAQELAYLVDLSADERRRNADRPGESTSKRLHFTNATFGALLSDFDLTLIDTPGGWRWSRRTRMRGIYYGDVAVFFIDVRTAIKCQRHHLSGHPTKMTETFGALFSWLATKPDAPLIVAISKMDRAQDPSDDFQRACGAIRDVLDGVCDPVIVPTAIDVGTRTSENVFARSAFADQHGAPCLSTAIADAARALPEKASVQHNAMVISRELPKPGFGTGYFGKVLTGAFVAGDRVRLAPITHSSGRPYAITGVVRAMISHKDNTIAEELSAGELGGLFFKSTPPRMGEISDYTIAVDDRTKLASGCFVRLHIDAASDRPAWLDFGVEIELLWLGRFCTMKVFELRPGTQGGLQIGLLMKSPKQVAMPIDESTGEPLFPDAQIGPPLDPTSYVPGKILHVGSIRRIQFHDDHPDIAEQIKASASKWATCGLGGHGPDSNPVETFLRRYSMKYVRSERASYFTTHFELIDDREDDAGD